MKVKVWIVQEVTHYDGYYGRIVEVEKVFSEEKKARDYADKNPDKYIVLEMEVE